MVLIHGVSTMHLTYHGCVCACDEHTMTTNAGALHCKSCTPSHAVVQSIMCVTACDAITVLAMKCVVSCGFYVAMCQITLVRQMYNTCANFGCWDAQHRVIIPCSHTLCSYPVVIPLVKASPQAKLTCCSARGHV